MFLSTVPKFKTPVYCNNLANNERKEDREKERQKLQITNHLKYQRHLYQINESE